MKVRTLPFVSGAIEKLETILDWVGLIPDEGKNFTICTRCDREAGNHS